MSIHRLRRDDVVRLNVSGDYLLPDGTPDHDYIAVTNQIPHYVTVISYTHAWRRMDPAWSRDWTRPNASCDTVGDVEDAAAAGWATVVVDPDGSLPGTTVAGRRNISCPYETSGRQCIDCRRCARGQRASTVVFAVHGTKKRAAAAILTRRTDAA